ERRDGQSLLTFERVYRGKEEILSRPNKQDKKDPILLTQTHLEQVSANAPFRSILSFLSGISYRHIVPQLLRHPEEIRGAGALYGDPFGSSLLMNLYSRPKKKRDAMLKKIESALRLLVPQMKRLRYKNDTSQGINPHLEATFEHWRSDSEWQREIGFSDGTLRLIGLFWALLNEHSLLLLEEPELSLNASVIARLPSLFSQMNQKLLTQIIVSTHSFDLLQDKGIGGEEVLLFMPEQEGTSIKAASDETEIRALLESGLSVADAVLPLTSPPKLSSNRIGLFS
ncbi:MAG: AAA family ATPase, partial [Candidatus Sumerlaeota bacterium]|nr:AAA family ATPase [Candidatus Sumerlaeota bacterium]